jgi:hypothetical protein
MSARLGEQKAIMAAPVNYEDWTNKDAQEIDHMPYTKISAAVSRRTRR